MKVIKRDGVCGICTSQIFVIPSITYSTLKIIGTTFNYEWVWGLSIPSFFVIWVLINYKIQRK